MSTKQDWRERWEEKDRDGDEVLEVCFWDNGEPARYKYHSNVCGTNATSVNVEKLIPRKPAPVVVPWEPDEVPVGAVVRWIINNDAVDIIFRRLRDKFEVNKTWFTCDELKDQFVLHKPGVAAEQCQPCGKVVKS